MSQALRKLSGAIAQSNTCMIFTNQLRQKIGVMFGNPETTTGGMALKFYASVRLDVRRIESIKHQGHVVGSRTRVSVKKNKVAPPFRQAEFDIMYNEGISRSGDLLDLAVEHDIIQKRGAFYSYGDTRLGQGRENAKAFLQDSPQIFAEIDGIMRERAGIARTLGPESEASKVVPMTKGSGKGAAAAKASKIVIEAEPNELDDEDPDDFDVELAA
jgi:recombination protein RecA